MVRGFQQIDQQRSARYRRYQRVRALIEWDPSTRSGGFAACWMFLGCARTARRGGGKSPQECKGVGRKAVTRPSSGEIAGKGAVANRLLLRSYSAPPPLVNALNDQKTSIIYLITIIHDCLYHHETSSITASPLSLFRPRSYPPCSATRRLQSTHLVSYLIHRVVCRISRLCNMADA